MLQPVSTLHKAQVRGSVGSVACTQRRSAAAAVAYTTAVAAAEHAVVSVYLELQLRVATLSNPSTLAMCNSHYHHTHTADYSTCACVVLWCARMRMQTYAHKRAVIGFGSGDTFVRTGLLHPAPWLSLTAFCVCASTCVPAGRTCSWAAGCHLQRWPC